MKKLAFIVLVLGLAFAACKPAPGGFQGQALVQGQHRCYNSYVELR